MNYSQAHHSAAEGPEPCHTPPDPGQWEPGTDVPHLPVYTPGDALTDIEEEILLQVAQLLFELEPEISVDSVRPDRSLWDLGYDSLALVALRVGIRRLYGPGLQPMVWLQLHGENPLIGCFVRFLASNGARPHEQSKTSSH